MSTTLPTAPKAKGNPTSAQPMPDLSLRAQKKLASTRYGVGVVAHCRIERAILGRMRCVMVAGQ